MVSNEVLIVVGIALVLVLGYIGIVSVPHQLEDFEKYANAPNCNNEMPKEPGICKWTESSWMVCEMGYNLEMGTDVLNCKEISKFDVST